MLQHDGSKKPMSNSVNTKVSPLCSLCNQHLEVVLHLFCNCIKTQDLRNSSVNASGEKLVSPLFSPTTVFLNEPNIPGNEDVLFNHILLLFKKFIYDNKNYQARIHILSITNYIKEAEKLEQKIAYRKGKLEFHFQKKNPIKHLF